jgi:ketosteroid isomerase-like protein
MRPVNVFPSTGRILHCVGRRRQGHQVYKRSLHLQTILTLPTNAGLASAIAVSVCIFMATFVGAAPQSPENAIAEIQSVLHAQQGAWNRGDIDEFMNGYAKSKSTVFVSDDEVRRGWEIVRDRYRQKYSDRTKIGTLGFSDIEVTVLSPDAAVVFGRWTLKRARDKPHGHFTLIFKHLPEGWRIVHDHTSAASSAK